MNSQGMTLVFFIMAFLLLYTFGASAADSCKTLSPEQRQVVNEQLSSQHPYACCRDTISACLNATPMCPLAKRLEQDICRLAGINMNRTGIEQALKLRATSMVPSAQLVTIHTDERFMAGDPDAPVVLIVYACGRNAHCAKLLPSLYAEITTGQLRGKVKLYFRPYFLKEHEGASACGRALVAAADQGLFWPFLLKLYENQDNFKQCMLRKWADVKGMDGCAFDLAYNSAATTDYLAASRQEALQNKVDTAPGVFINGRKYVYALTLESLLDVLQEEYERI